jgi:hypothetical protein
LLARQRLIYDKNTKEVGEAVGFYDFVTDAENCTGLLVTERFFCHLFGFDDPSSAHRLINVDE